MIEILMCKTKECSMIRFCARAELFKHAEFLKMNTTNVPKYEPTTCAYCIRTNKENTYV